MPLTLKMIEDAKRSPGRHLDEAGLYLQVSKTGAASWILRFERGGRERAYGLGSLKTWNLKEARERARLARQKLDMGVDPIEDRRAEKAAVAMEAAKALTFSAATKAYYSQHSGKWGQRSREQFMASLETYALPVLGALSVAAIDTGLVLKVLEHDRFWHEKTETASRVRGRIERILDWATVRGYRSGDNPARWRGYLDKVLPARPEVVHHRALPWAALPGLMADVAALPGIPPLALRFLILTATRTAETIGARWNEIDETTATWTIPATRTKTKIVHRVPLSSGTIDILAAVPRVNEFVFPGFRQDAPINNISLGLILKKGLGRRDIVVHGFRSTFRDYCAERTNYPREIAEQALGHATGSAVELSYRRSDLLEQRRSLMEAYSRFATTPAADATVVPMRKLG